MRRGRRGGDRGSPRPAEARLDVVSDCAIAPGALFQRPYPTIMWAKFEALVEGARLASERLWR